MTAQLTLELAARDAALRDLEDRNGDVLAHLRVVLAGLYLDRKRRNGREAFVTADDARRYLERHPEIAAKLTSMKALGSLFATREWRKVSPYRDHVTEKPVDLLQVLMRLSRTGTAILDPFCGSGTTLIAAKNLGRKAVGIEIEERYCEIAAERLSQGVLGLEAAGSTS